MNGPVNLNRLSALCGIVERPKLKYTPLCRQRSLDLSLGISSPFCDSDRYSCITLTNPFRRSSIFSGRRPRIALCSRSHPLPNRGDSPLVQALIDAARRGTEVTAVVELRARFDEAANIDLATRLQAVGANVVYGVVGYKAHAKMLMVVRREGRELKRYVHLGTGNYHSGTAKAYTDWGLLSSDPELGEDMNRTFQMLTGLGKAAQLSKFFSCAVYNSQDALGITRL